MKYSLIYLTESQFINFELGAKFSFLVFALKGRNCL